MRILRADAYTVMPIVGDMANLDGKFSAFGRVRSGMEVADQINKAPVEGEKPERPVRITRARVKALRSMISSGL